MNIVVRADSTVHFRELLLGSSEGHEQASDVDHATDDEVAANSVSNSFYKLR